MVKTKEDLKKKSKERRKRLAEDSKKLKHKKEWYPTSLTRSHFQRKKKISRVTRLRKDIVPGQVLILLSGRFRGRRVVFLKQLPSGLLLVTGPYKVNGVPLKRVNQAYVIPTKTHVKLGSIPRLDSVSDEFFAAKVKITRGKEPKDFFEDRKKKKERITETRSEAQGTIDTEVLKEIKKVDLLKDYLKNRFALKNGDKPHLMTY